MVNDCSVKELNLSYEYSSCSILDCIKEKLDRNSKLLGQAEAYIPLKSNPLYQSLTDRFRKKYNEIIDEEIHEKCTDDEILAETVEYDSGQILCFDDDSESNKNKVLKIMDNIDELRKDYSHELENVAANEIYFKTIDKLNSQMNRIIDNKRFSPDKLVSDITKYFTQTIIKNYSNALLVEAIDNFFERCNFKKVELQIGKKLEDEDFEYIGSNAMKVNVSDKSKHNTIIEKKHDAFEFRCYDMEEEEYYTKIIPGEYAIGCWRE